MSTTHDAAAGDGPYVTRELCEAVHAEQREANARTWDELRMMRRLVILLVVGGQLFSGGLNLAGLGYWLQHHAAQPHATTIEMVATARAELRDDLRDLRRDMHELLATAPAPSRPAYRPPDPPKGGTE